MGKKTDLVLIITKEILTDLYVNKQLSAIKIAKQFNVKHYQVYYLLDKYDITRRIYSKMGRQHVVDNDFFEIIDCVRKAYWLGFLYADGYLAGGNVIGLSLGIVDKFHIVKFNNAIRSSYEVKTYIQTHGYSVCSEYARVLIYSQKMYDDLCQKGCLPHKSLILQFPSEKVVPRYLLNAFLLGYFDGDGCLTTNGSNHVRLKFCGTKEFLKGLYDYFSEEFPQNISPFSLESRHKNGKNNYSLSINTNYRVFAILETFYAQSDTYLERKYKKYKALVSLIQPQM